MTNRLFSFHRTLGLLASFALTLTAANAANRVVFLAGGRSHGPGEHEFNAGCMILAKALNEQSGLDIQATVIQGWPKDESVLEGIKALVIYADGTSVVGKGWTKVDSLAKKGTGIMFMHYAVHPSPADGEKYYRPWIGGAFEDGWSVNPHWVADLQTLPNHPVSRGVPSLVQALDEFYYNMRFSKDREKVLDLVTATPTRQRVKKYINLWNEHGVAGLDKPQTLMWGIERPDGGRGVGFTGGHYHRNWAIDGFRKIALNAIVWTAGLEVPKDGVKSKPLTEDELNANLDEKGNNKPRVTIPVAGEFEKIPPGEVQTKREEGFGKNAAKPAPKAATAPSGSAKPAFTSPVIEATTKPRLAAVDASIKGAKELHLIVSDEGATSCDWSTWIEPKLIMADGKTISLTELKWKEASADHGNVQVDKSNGNGAITVEKKTYRGISAHASSSISYDLPAGVEKFQAQVAIDDGGIERDGRPSDAKVRFYVYTEKPGKLPRPADGPPEVPVDLFVAPDQLEVTLWATSPMLFNPTNIDFDAQGRLYVAEGVNYRGKGGRKKEGDRIVVLEDTTGAGKADKVTVFVEDAKLASPLGVAVLGNQIVVSQPPDMLVYTDVDQNGVFDASKDKQEVLLTGFAGRQHDHSLHSVTAGPDGQWYWNQGNTGAEFTDRSGKKFYMGSPYMMQSIAGKVSDDGNVWIGGFAARMNPDGTNVKILGHNFRNSYEQTVTSFGDIFQSDNDDPPACRVTEVIEGGNAGFASADGLRAWGADKRPGQDTPTAEWRQEDPGTMPSGDVYGGGSPTGVAFYENGVLPDKWRGLLLACEAGKNVVFGYLPVRDGAGFNLERIDFLTSNKEKEFAGSDFLGGKANGELKTKFRPSDVCVGPDGAIYVADWFDARVGGHGTMDEGWTGAIYRIAPKGFKSVVPKLDLNTTEGQIAALKNPSPNVRYNGFTRLKAQGEKAVPAVAELLKETNPYIFSRAIWLLAQLGKSGMEKVTALLESKDETQRLVAYRALRRVQPDMVSFAKKLASDPSAAVRREVALSLREVPADQSVPLLVKVAEKFDGKDRAYLDALGLGSTGKEREVYTAIAKVMGSAPEAWTEAFAWISWRLHTPEAVEHFKARALSDKLSLDQRKLMVNGLAFVKSREAAGAMIQLANTKNFPHQELAKWWLMSRKGNDWKPYDVEGGMKALGIYDPEKVKLVAVEMPAENKDAPKLPAAAEIAKLKGDPARGATLLPVCYSCHKFDKNGVDFGPDLTTFGKQQTLEVLINAIANPSSDISHGYEGSEIKTTDGLTITGMVLADGDPVIIKCMGGMIQTVPKAKIASLKKMTKSLMYPASQFGLDAQAIADLAAFLRK